MSLFQPFMKMKKHLNFEISALYQRMNGEMNITYQIKCWFVILRLYGPLQPWFDKTWKPGEIVEVK